MIKFHVRVISSRQTCPLTVGNQIFHCPLTELMASDLAKGCWVDTFDFLAKRKYNGLSSRGLVYQLNEVCHSIWTA